METIDYSKYYSLIIYYLQDSFNFNGLTENEIISAFKEFVNDDIEYFLKCSKNEYFDTNNRDNLWEFFLEKFGDERNII